MFFADATAAFTNIGRALKPGGRLALQGWRAGGEARLVAYATRSPRPRPTRRRPTNAPGRFALADPDGVSATLTEAGFTDIAFEAVDTPLYFGTDPDDTSIYVSGQGVFRGLTEELDDHVQGSGDRQAEAGARRPRQRRRRPARRRVLDNHRPPRLVPRLLPVSCRASARLGPADGSGAAEVGVVPPDGAGDEAAVDDELGAGAVGAGVRCQPASPAGDLVGARAPMGTCLSSMGRMSTPPERLGLDHGGVDAGRGAPSSPARRAGPARGRRTGSCRAPRTCRDIRRHARGADEPVDRADVDDRPPLTLDDLGDGGVHAEEHADLVDIQ